MKVTPFAWFTQMWPYDGGRRLVLADYAAIGAQHKHFLADIALRGAVFRAIEADSEREAAIWEGRRQMALEIVNLCKVDPNLLFDEFIAKKPREGKP